MDWLVELFELSKEGSFTAYILCSFSGHQAKYSWLEMLPGHAHNVNGGFLRGGDLQILCKGTVALLNGIDEEPNGPKHILIQQQKLFLIMIVTMRTSVADCLLPNLWKLAV